MNDKEKRKRALKISFYKRNEKLKHTYRIQITSFTQKWSDEIFSSSCQISNLVNIAFNAWSTSECLSNSMSTLIYFPKNKLNN